MSGNLGETYESFLVRCIWGIHKEEETFPEVEKVAEHLKFLEKQLELLEKKGIVEGLRKGWVSKGTGTLTESNWKENEAFIKEGDVYSLLSASRNLVKHCEEVLTTGEATLDAMRRKREQELKENAITTMHC